MSEKKLRGILVVLSAPSGCSKTTVVRELLKRNKSLVRSISWTTRIPRTGEKHNRDYFFVTKKKFLGSRERNQFLEWARVYHEYYGTPKSFVSGQLRKGRDVVLVIDTRGAKKVRRQVPCLLLFLQPPSLTELKKRLKKRNADSKIQIQKRIKEAHYEMKQARQYDYQIVNRAVGKTVREIERIIEKEKIKTAVSHQPSAVSF